jgi:uncharacterized protein YodC (DUF2158 family)
MRNEKMTKDDEVRLLEQLGADFIAGKLDEPSEANTVSLRQLQLLCGPMYFRDLQKEKRKFAEDNAGPLTPAQALPGALVRLRGGSPVMTLTCNYERAVETMWFVGETPRTGNFQLATLVLVRAAVPH